MCICKKSDKSITYLTKECYESAKICLIFKLEWIVATLSKDHNRTICIESIGDSYITYDLDMFFAFVSSIYAKIMKFSVAGWCDL